MDEDLRRFAVFTRTAAGRRQPRGGDHDGHGYYALELQLRALLRRELAAFPALAETSGRRHPDSSSKMTIATARCVQSSAQLRAGPLTKP